MREIEFRVYTEHDNGMEYYEDLEQFCYAFDAGFMYNEKVMQYTGLKDKNGVKIFEGDIVLDYRGRQGVIREPEFDSGMSDWCIFGWVLGTRDDSPETMVVIGNVYENPELLTK